MDVLEFANIQRRMCKTYVSCKGCSLNHGFCRLANGTKERDEEIIDVVEKWAKEHPIKTRQSEFLKLHPHTTLDNDGIIRACVSDMECDFICNGNCVKCRKDYWLEEI